MVGGTGSRGLRGKGQAISLPATYPPAVACLSTAPFPLAAVLEGGGEGRVTNLWQPCPQHQILHMEEYNKFITLPCIGGSS